MTNVAYNSPQYGYGSGMPQPPMPQPLPVDDDETGDRTSMASYDVDPAYEHAPPEHAPPAVVQQPSAGAPPGAPTSGAPASGAPSSAPTSGAPAAAPTSGAPASGAESAGPWDAAPPQPVSGAPAVSSGRVAVQVVDRMRSTAERGTTTVPNGVIEKIATLAVREVPGVYQFGSTDDKPMAINLDGRAATVEIHVVVEYGFAVYAVTDKVRTKVISALENLFALEVTAVDIVIDDIHIEPPEPTAED